MQWVVYILLCADSTFYIGSTNDLPSRLHAHNTLKSGAKYTHARRPVKVVYTEKCADLSAARRREYSLKKLTHKQKIILIGLQ